MAINPSSTPFPDILAPKEEKSTNEYGLSYARAIWGDRIANQDTYNENRRIFLRNREYAEGLQSMQNVKERKAITDTSYLNLDFRPVNIIATTIDNIVGKLCRLEYRPTCTPLDSESKNERDRYRDKLRTNRFLKQFSDQLEPLTGMPLVDKGMKIPETDEEEEIYMQMNFKWASSVAMEEGLSFVHKANGFPEVKEAVLRDLLTNKISAIRTYYDEDYNIKYERIDVLDLAYPFTKTEDFKNINQIGIFRELTLGEIAKMRNFSAEELHDIGKANAGRSTNGSWQWGDNFRDSVYFNTNQVPQYYSFLISVLDFEFLGIDKEVREFKTVKRRKYLNDLKTEDIDNATGEVISRSIQNRYEGSWIVGTDHLVKYGKAKNMTRERISGSYSPRTELTISIIAPNMFNMKNKSHVERMIPHEEQIQLAHLGLQGALIKAKPNGVAVDVRGLVDAALAMGEGMQPIDLLKIYELTGNLVYSSSDANGDIVNSKVITELRGGAGGLIQEFITAYQFERQLINEVIGYNSVVDGSSPRPDVGLGQQKNAIEATNNSLAPIFNAHLKLVGQANKKTALMIQDCIEHNNEAFINAIGAHSTTILEYGKKLAFIQMGIDIELLPDDLEKAEINEQIRLAQMSVPPLLTPSDVIRVRQLMKTNVKLAGQLLSYLEEKNRKTRMEESAALQKQNGDIQMQSAQAATQGAMQADAVATENKIKYLQAETQAKSQLSSQDFEQQMQLLTTQLQGQGAHKHADNMTKLAVQNLANEGKVEQQEISNDHEHEMSEKDHDQTIEQEAFKSLVTPKKEPAKK